MNIHPETVISGTSSNRITTRTRIKGEVRRFQVPNGDDLTGSAETEAYLLVQVDRFRRWIRQFGLPPLDREEIHASPQLLQFPLNFRIMCSNIESYLHQELQSLLLEDIIPQDFWNEFIDTLTSKFKTILSDYSVTTRRKSGEVEILCVDVEVVNEERYDTQRFLEHVSLESLLETFEHDEDQSFRETPASQDSVDALKTMTYEENRYDESIHGCSICLNECLNGSMIKWMPCSHVFHSECIDGWLKKKNTCPLCRFEMPTSQP